MKGWAESAEEVVKNAKVSLAALRFGAGLKGKLAEAMKCGTPNVTTAIGTEGMSGNLPWSGYVAENAVEFAQAAVSLYNDKEAWIAFQQNGFNLIENRFEKTKFHSILNNRLADLASKLQEYRNSNFIGTMLSHHSLKSTQHLSKYIQIKNELERLKADNLKQDFSPN